MNDSPTTVAVIGGGIIGAFTAYQLARRGLKVTVIEKDAFGHGSSWGNCGIILPSHVLPLNSLENVANGLRWMLKKDAPFHIAPRFDPALMAWLIRFALRCRSSVIDRSARGTAAMLQGAADAFQDIIETENIRCEWRRDGALFLFRGNHAFRDYAATDATTRQYGHGCTPLARAELIRREPATGPQIVGAWMDEGAAHLRPDFLMKEMRRVLEQQGVTLLEGNPVSAFRVNRGRAVAAKTAQGWVEADAFALTTGAWTPLLSSAINLTLPIQPGKGYSITLTGAGSGPSIPCFFEELRVVATPWRSGLRLGGTMEFAGYDDRLNRHRIEALLRGARNYLDMKSFGHLEDEWYGWRPMTVDGLPVIDRVPGLESVVVAAGHNMLGITMAPATGKMVADMITGVPPEIDPTPYRISRF